MQISIVECGAIADGVTNNAKYIQSAINEVAANGGGRVLIPAGGSFLSGSFELLPKVELHLESGAILLASGDYADYSPEHAIDVLTDGEVNEVVLPRRAFIVGFRAHGASITGLGTINGNADAFIATRGEYIHQMRGPIGGRDQYLERPFTIFLIESYGVKMVDVTITDPAFWAVRFTGCNNLDINGIRILSDLMVPNGDGIDIDRCQG
jgi:polygalacturonase